MSEPGAGSDLRGIATRARRDGDAYVVTGSKTFISSGTQADLVIVAARTGEDPRSRSSLSLFAVEGDMEGFERGRKLGKVGRAQQDTAELFFNDVRVPLENRLGEEGEGMANLTRNLSRERLSVSVAGLAAARYALAITLDYVRERSAFGRPIGSFQANRFALAELSTELAAATVYGDRCIAAELGGELTAVEAAGLKAYTTELQWKVVDRCLQLHGGYGYMDEYEISRQWRDARVQRIYGGTTEIMWEIVGRSLGL
jgi:alkylation response protein AidB-like acyl-CoA dehydrogenase